MFRITLFAVVCSFVEFASLLPPNVVLPAHAEYAMVLNIMARNGAESHADRVVQLATLALDSAKEPTAIYDDFSVILKQAARRLISGRVGWLLFYADWSTSP